eukprot:8084344-Alexandrium_andersonii.AAC.1
MPMALVGGPLIHSGSCTAAPLEAGSTVSSGFLCTWLLLRRIRRPVRVRRVSTFRARDRRHKGV